MEAPAPKYDRGVDLTFADVMNQYAAQNATKLVAQLPFLDAYAQVNLCEEWKTTHNNEFDAPATLAKAKAAIEALKPAPANRYSLTTAVAFGQYDALKGGFPFQLIENADLKLSFPLRPTAEADKAECTPTSPAWPAMLTLQVKNPAVFDGIPMKPEEGRAFLQKYPNRQVYITLTFAIEKWGNIVGSSRNMDLTASIVDAAVIGPTGNIDYRFDSTYFANAARTLAEAQAKRALEPVPFSLIYYDAWSDFLQGKGPDTLRDGSKLRDMLMDSGAFYLRTSSPKLPLAVGSVTLGGWPKDDLIAETQYQGARRIAIINAADFAGPLPLSEADLQRIAPTADNSPLNATLRIIARPVKFEHPANDFSTLSVFVKEVQIIPPDKTPIVLPAKSAMAQ